MREVILLIELLKDLKVACDVITIPPVVTCKVFKDNQSCIQLHKNYLFSVGKESKYINIRYFFMVDNIENKNVRVVYYLIDNMIADYSTKPTQ